MRRKPWIFGEPIFHRLCDYSCQHSLFLTLHRLSRVRLQRIRNALLPCVNFTEEAKRTSPYFKLVGGRRLDLNQRPLWFDHSALTSSFPEPSELHPHLIYLLSKQRTKEWSGRLELNQQPSPYAKRWSTSPLSNKMTLYRELRPLLPL